MLGEGREGGLAMEACLYREKGIEIYMYIYIFHDEWRKLRKKARYSFATIDKPMTERLFEGSVDTAIEIATIESKRR